MAEPPFHIHGDGLRAAADIVEHLDELGFSVSMAEVQPNRTSPGVHEILIEAAGDWIEDQERLQEKVDAVQSEHAEEIHVGLGSPLTSTDGSEPAVLWEMHAVVYHDELGGEDGQ